MHSITSPRDGWEEEFLSDDSDRKYINNSLEEELKGCSFIKEIKENETYASEIRYEEKIHNFLVFVEAVVFRKNGSFLGENGLTDLRLFRRKGFQGDECKTNASDYASKLKKDIDLIYFP
jgi:hypothetical protein